MNDVTRDVIGSALRIHRALGPGLLESVYESILERDLRRAGFDVERQRYVSFAFEGMTFENAFRVDLLVERRLVVEVKSMEQRSALHARQLLTYLRLMHLPLGLILNFSNPMMLDGVTRVVNRFEDDAGADSPQSG